MIEPTDHMIYAYAGEPEITATDAHHIRHGLTAVLNLPEVRQLVLTARPVEFREGPDDVTVHVGNVRVLQISKKHPHGAEVNDAIVDVLEALGIQPRRVEAER